MICVPPGYFSKQRHWGNWEELAESVKLDYTALHLHGHSLSEERP